MAWKINRPVRHTSALSSCIAVAFALAACQSGEPEILPDLTPISRSTGLPDIVLISIDSLRYDHLGSYGYPLPTSPAMDRIAAEGVRFENAVSTTSWTLPSHAAMFTGLYDSAHGVVDNGKRLSEGFVTLAEVLRDGGYHTAGFYSGPYLHPAFGLGQGFDTYASAMTTIPDDSSESEIRASAQAVDGASHADITGPRVRNEVGKWLQDIDGRPFFLFLHMWDVHYDYIPPRQYIDMFDPDYRGNLDARRFSTNRGIHAGMPARDLQHLIALYDGEIRLTDDTLAAIFDMLDKAGRLEETLLVITADHGEEFFEHGRKGHHQTLYEEVIRVPLIVRWPGRIPGGQVIEDQVRLIDIMPTLLSLSGLPQPAVQGRDLTPLLQGQALTAEPALAELLLNGANVRALRTNTEKLISVEDRRFMYFDLEADPNELRSLPADESDFARARNLLRTMTDSALQMGAHLGGEGDSEIPMDPTMCRRLRALGYLETTTDCGT